MTGPAVAAATTGNQSGRKGSSAASPGEQQHAGDGAPNCLIVRTKTGETRTYYLDEVWAQHFANDPTSGKFWAQSRLDNVVGEIARDAKGSDVTRIAIGGTETAPDDSRNAKGQRTAGLTVRSPKDQAPLGEARRKAATPDIQKALDAARVDPAEQKAKLEPFEFNLTEPQMKPIRAFARQYKTSVLDLVERYHRDRPWMQKHRSDVVDYFDSNFGVKGVRIEVTFVHSKPTIVCKFTPDAVASHPGFPFQMSVPPVTAVESRRVQEAALVPRTGPVLPVGLEHYSGRGIPQHTSGPINAFQRPEVIKQPRSGNYSSQGNGGPASGPRLAGKKHHHDGIRMGEVAEAKAGGRARAQKDRRRDRPRVQDLSDSKRGAKNPFVAAAVGQPSQGDHRHFDSGLARSN